MWHALVLAVLVTQQGGFLSSGCAPDPSEEPPLSEALWAGRVLSGPLPCGERRALPRGGWWEMARD